MIDMLIKDNSLLFKSVNHLNKKVEELEDNLAFYATSINILEMTVKKLSHDFHEEQYLDPQIFKVTKEEFYHLEAELNKPPKKNKNLSKLFNANKDNYAEKLDAMILEKKVRDAIITKLEAEQNLNSCACGDICQAYDNGFQTAISFIRNM